jgi:hypothetical protein
VGSSDYVGSSLFLFFPASSFVAHFYKRHSLTYFSNSALYIRNDPYETSDAVFGVKQSLIVDFDAVDAATANKYGVAEGSKVLKHDFVLVSDKETEKLRDENALKEMKALGRRVKLLNHLPVPDVD